MRQQHTIFDSFEVNVYDGDRLVAFSFFDLGDTSIASIKPTMKIGGVTNKAYLVVNHKLFRNCLSLNNVSKLPRPINLVAPNKGQLCRHTHTAIANGATKNTKMTSTLGNTKKSPARCRAANPLAPLFVDGTIFVSVVIDIQYLRRGTD